MVQQTPLSIRSVDRSKNQRAHNLILTRRLLRTEAVLVTWKKALDGGLNNAQALSIAGQFNNALGECGCTCGELRGALMISGLFEGNSQRSDWLMPLTNNPIGD